MGNDCCSSRKDFKASFTENERTILRFLYSDLTEAHRAKGSTKFNKDTLKYLFPENPDMAVWIYNLMLTTSESNIVDYEAFENALEVLVRDHKAIELKEFRNLDKLDMLVLLMLGDFTLKKGDLRQKNISYIQAFDYVRNLLKIFQYKLPVARPIDEFALKVVVDSFFKDGHDRPDWGNFIRYIRENLPFANRSLQTFFIEKFLPSQNNLTLPDLSKPSQLLNRDFIGLLYLSNIYMENLSRLQLLYSSAYNGLSFERLAHALNGFNDSTYIILKVVPLQNGTEDNFSIIGGFNRLAWKSNNDFHEDSDSCVFSLVPHFRNYYILDNIHADQNYTYFKSGSGVASGIGFGGTGHDDFRIWIDGTNFNKSYVRSEDHIYTPGDLINGPPGYIKILNIEVWGLSSETPSTINTSPATGLSGVSYSQPKIPSLTTTAPNYLDQAMSNFENRLSKIEQERQSRGLMGSQLQSQGTSGSVQHIENIQQYEAVKKSYQPPSRGHGDLTYTSTVVSSEQSKRAVNNGDYHFSGRKTYTTPNMNIDLGVENIDRGRSTHIETRDYHNPFKNEYPEKNPALFTGPKNKNYVNAFH